VNRQIEIKTHECVLRRLRWRIGDESRKLKMNENESLVEKMFKKSFLLFLFFKPNKSSKVYFFGFYRMCFGLVLIFGMNFSLKLYGYYF